MRIGPQAAANRELQTRQFRDVSEAALLATSVGVLQDLGFRIRASEAHLGVVTGIKPRPLEDILLDIGRLSLLGGATLGLHPEAAMGPSDSFGVVLATRAIGGQARVYDVRVTFYWMWVGPGSPSPDMVRGAMVIRSATLYQEFFALLGTALARSQLGN